MSRGLKERISTISDLLTIVGIVDDILDELHNIMLSAKY